MSVGRGLRRVVLALRWGALAPPLVLVALFTPTWYADGEMPASDALITFLVVAAAPSAAMLLVAWLIDGFLPPRT